MKNIKEYLITENEQTIKFILDNTMLLGAQSIDPSEYDFRDNELLERIAGPLLEYIIVMKFLDNVDQTDSFLFTDIHWNKNSDIWDFSAKINKKFIKNNNITNTKGLPIGKKLNFEVKAFKGDPHNITLTKSQIDSLSDNVYFILIDYSIVDGAFDVNDMYLVDGSQMKSIIGSKTVKKSGFEKLFGTK